MTRIERVKAAIKAGGYEKDTLDALIAFAYYAGREEATKESHDKYNALIEEQNKRADECRYSHMAHKVVGDQKYIYSPDYAGDMLETYGSDETEL